MATSETRRGLIVGLGASALLAACGGGADAPGGPRIEEFSADQTSTFVGESVRLTAHFSGGSGRIEPWIGAVTSGVPVSTPRLPGPVNFRLIVDNGVVQTTRDLSLAVGYRNRYRAVAQSFISARHATVLVGDGSVLVIGGSRGESSLSHRITRFEPIGETLSHIGTLGSGREFHTATLLADGRVLVAGGQLSLSGFSASEIIDPRDGSVAEVGTLKQRRHGHTATRLGDGRVLVAGGWGPNGDPAGLLATAEIFDPATGQFRMLSATMANSRGGHTATLLADGRVLIAGGFSRYPTYRLAEVFDPASESFAPATSSHGAQLAMHSAHDQIDNSVLLLGGENESGSEASAAVLRFDPARNAIEAMPPLTAPRTLVAGVSAADGRVLLFGGADADLLASARAEAYRAGSGATSLAQMPVTRAWHSVTRLASGRVLIVGGEDYTRNYVSSVLLYE